MRSLASGLWLPPLLGFPELQDREFVGITVLFLDEKNSPFQAEQQMEANFSESSSTSRQNQKIDVGGRLIKGILQRSETA
ncbi:hypothetical protein HID58_085986 [Brassica napus]|uniref:Uncharacterized protein n=1 Tax=Brassica napus TaxID=3708 RepID=A0ABQ7XP42_BRANA|nr:hypothetical protein HID58_085986 [Brassica napus]